MKIDLENSRYHRQELITWWDQARLTKSKVLVVGAGAIGNEVVKNLALVGVGEISVVDMDVIEHSNLARCVFFRVSDEGKFKAEVLARSAMELNSEISVTAHSMAVQRLGIAFLSDFDLVIGALDNREARAWVNQACRKVGIPWIDGAIEGLRGVVRTFTSDGPCYECTLTEADYRQMSHRRSCALLAPEEIMNGKTPTNATTAGIVAGVQVQEAIKYLVGNSELLALNGKCWVYTGDSMTTYVVAYEEDLECIAHDRYVKIVRPTEVPNMFTLVEAARDYLSDEPIAVDFEEEIIEIRPCKNCSSAELGTVRYKLRSSFEPGAGVCSNCGENLAGEMSTSLSASDQRLSLNAGEIGLAYKDIVTVRSASGRVHFSIHGDKNGS